MTEGKQDLSCAGAVAHGKIKERRAASGRVYASETAQAVGARREARRPNAER